MFKYIILIPFMWFFCAKSQNLVPNSGFEEVDCTDEIIELPISYCHDWFNGCETQSTDVFHSCITDSHFHPPYIIDSYSFPRNGDGMGGFIALVKNDLYTSREVFSVQLKQSLEKDSVYFLQFYVKNANRFEVKYGLDNIGVLFTSDTITKDIMLENHPDIRSIERVIMDETEWVEISGYYTANGNEKFLNLGTFGSNISIEWYYSGSDIMPNSLPAFLYYFVDDIVLTKVNKDSLFTVYLDIPNVFTPNNDGLNDELYLKYQNIKKMNVSVVNRFGVIVKSYNGLLNSWDGTNSTESSCTDGVYFVKIEAIDNFGKEFSKQQMVTLIR